MELMRYDYKCYETINDICSANKELFASLLGKRVLGVYCVWDCISNTWFEDGPAIIEFEHGDLTVFIYCLSRIGIVWNLIDRNDKPVWFENASEIPDWHEDLIWKKRDELYNAAGKVCKIEIVDSFGIPLGIVFSLDNGSRFALANGGDITQAVSNFEIDDYFLNCLDNKSTVKYIDVLTLQEKVLRI